MNKLIFVAVGGVLTSASFAQTFTATGDSVIETTGTYSTDATSFNFGLASGKYNSFGVVDFDAASIAGDKITSATLTLNHYDYTPSKATVITVWAVSDNTDNVGSGNTTIVYGTGSGYTDGLGSQLGTATELTSYNYIPQSGAAANTYQDVVTLSNLSALTSLVATPSSDIRIVLTSDQLGEATYYGTKGSVPPSLTVSAAATPEPTSMCALALGGLVLLRRRKKS